MTPRNVKRAYRLLIDKEQMMERIAESAEAAESDLLWRAIGNTITLLVDLGVDVHPHVGLDETIEAARASRPAFMMAQARKRSADDEGKEMTRWPTNH